MSVTKEQVRPYISEPMEDEQIDAIIAKHIDPHPHGFGPARARLHGPGVSVAALIANLEALNGDVQKTAADFNATVEEVLAAIYFYWKNQTVIDAEITVRRSGFQSNSAA